LKETYQAEIIAFCADVGQEEELDGLEAKAIGTGASKIHIDNLCEEFAKDFIFPMIQANAIYEGQYFLGTSIARPLIAKRMVEIARAENAHAVAHGATGKGNDQVRFELTAAALAPELEVIAPWRQDRFREQFPGRAEMIAYCEQRRIPVQATAKKPYSMDRNLLHISFEAGILEDPWFDASAPESAGMYVLSVSPEQAPDRMESVELSFETGLCTAVGHPEWVAGSALGSLQDGREGSELPVRSSAWSRIPELHLATLSLREMRLLAREEHLWGYARLPRQALNDQLLRRLRGRERSRQSKRRTARAGSLL
jgi:argininosuccinate synthase